MAVSRRSTLCSCGPMGFSVLFQIGFCFGLGWVSSLDLDRRDRGAKLADSIWWVRTTTGEFEARKCLVGAPIVRSRRLPP